MLWVICFWDGSRSQSVLFEMFPPAMRGGCNSELAGWPFEISCASGANECMVPVGPCGSMWLSVSVLGWGKSMCWTEDGGLRWNGSQLRRRCMQWLLGAEVYGVNHTWHEIHRNLAFSRWEHACIDWNCLSDVYLCSAVYLWPDVTQISLH